MKALVGKRIIVCGGSKGIGLETARLAAKLGADVCIVARNLQALEKAEELIKNDRASDNQVFLSYSADAADPAAVEPIFNDYLEKFGPPDYLINNVGYAYPQYISKLKLEDFKANMDVNYYGQLVPTLIMLPHMIEKKSGHISFTSSMMGYFGIMGYGAYAPTKFALVGLAEVLRHELKPHNINISILYPPDTETPGFDTENESKPVECKKMSESVKAISAEKAAEIFVNGLLKKQYQILPGEAKMVWLLHRFIPGIVRRILDNDYKKILSELGN